jgi:thioredoxin-related protein
MNKIMNCQLLIVPGIILLLLGFSFPGWCAQINWTPYQQAFEIAEKEDKKVFIFFKSSRCRYCDDMERVTFSNAKVIEKLNNHFVPVQVSAEKQRGLIRRFNVPGYPDNRFFESSQKQVVQFFGFQKPGVFLVFLDFVRTESYKTMEVMEFYKSFYSSSD